MKLLKAMGLCLVGLTLSAGFSALHAETLKVGGTPTGAPFTYLDTNTQSITGMMIDLARSVGREAHFDVEVQTVDWVSLIPALTSGRIDMISAAMSITDARKQVVDFSDPVFPYGEGLVVRKDDKLTYGEDLKETAGGVIGVQQGTLTQIGLQKMSGIGRLQVYENTADMLRDLSLGRLQVAFVDRPIMIYQFSQGKFPDLALSPNYRSQFAAPLGLAIKKGNPQLLARINAALAKLQASGEIEALAKKWHVD